MLLVVTREINFEVLRVVVGVRRIVCGVEVNSEQET